MNYNIEGVPLDIIDYIDELKSQNENKAFELTGAQTEVWRLEAIEKQQQKHIEQLREALHHIGLPKSKIVYCRDGHEEAVLTARKVLEETK